MHPRRRPKIRPAPISTRCWPAVRGRARRRAAGGDAALRDTWPRRRQQVRRSPGHGTRCVLASRGHGRRGGRAGVHRPLHRRRQERSATSRVVLDHRRRDAAPAGGSAPTSPPSASRAVPGRRSTKTSWAPCARPCACWLPATTSGVRCRSPSSDEFFERHHRAWVGRCCDCNMQNVLLQITTVA